MDLRGGLDVLEKKKLSLLPGIERRIFQSRSIASNSKIIDG